MTRTKLVGLASPVLLTTVTREANAALTGVKKSASEFSSLEGCEDNHLCPLETSKLSLLYVSFLLIEMDFLNSGFLSAMFINVPNRFESILHL